MSPASAFGFVTINGSRTQVEPPRMKTAPYTPTEEITRVARDPGLPSTLPKKARGSSTISGRAPSPNTLTRASSVKRLASAMRSSISPSDKGSLIPRVGSSDSNSSRVLTGTRDESKSWTLWNGTGRVGPESDSNAWANGAETANNEIPHHDIVVRNRLRDDERERGGGGG